MNFPESTTGPSLSIEALMKAARVLRSEPQCVCVFTWDLAAADSVLQFTAPLEAGTVSWLGPYAKDILDALTGAADGDFVWLLNPVSLLLACPPVLGWTPLSAFNSLMGIPVRELRRDPEWRPPPLFGEPWAWSLGEAKKSVDEALERLRLVTEGDDG